LQKERRHKSQEKVKRQLIQTTSLVLLSLVLSASYVVRVNTITFASSDGLEITADEYVVSDTLPYIILFHEQESSRGEFHSIAQRLTKMNYNCLAVDLRNGGNNNNISNETAKHCRESRCKKGVDDIEKDMIAAIDYVASISSEPVILFGCGANGSLSLKLAKENSQVKAVLALSPGEYFLPGVNIQEAVADLDKPVFITSSKPETPFVKQLSSGISGEFLTLFEPTLSDGGRGSSALSTENPYNSEYWLALILFFKDLI
jgi:pimeloyl-ACP methyl ester carboxylesterase